MFFRRAKQGTPELFSSDHVRICPRQMQALGNVAIGAGYIPAESIKCPIDCEGPAVSTETVSFLFGVITVDQPICPPDEVEDYIQALS